MTTEDDFQRALDANPDDWQYRLVFADWLEERGDERAAGYRAVGAMRLRADTGADTSSFSHRGNPNYSDWLYDRTGGRLISPAGWC